MKIFSDTANLNDIESNLSRGIVSGITTNPSILSKEPKTDFVKHIKKIAALCIKYNSIVPLSVEVFTGNAKKMVKQAIELVDKINYENINIKVPIGWNELEVINYLVKQGIKINATCLFNEAQCVLAANAGATYVSLFMGRMKDIGVEPLGVIKKTRTLIDWSGKDTEIIIGSIRHERDIIDSFIAGAHIVTADPKFFPKMATHPQTDKSVEGFLKDFEQWLK